MGRSEEFHNGTHVLEPSVWGANGENHAAFCAKCNTGFSGSEDPDSPARMHRDYVGTADQAAARREKRVKNQQILRDRYGDNVIGPDAVRGAMADRPHSAQR